MQDQPDKGTLLKAVRDLLKGSVMPAIEDPALRFRVLVAVNVLGVVGRELETEDAHWAAEVERLAALVGEDALDPALCGDRERHAALVEARRALAEGLESGEVDPEAAFEPIRDALRDKLSVVNPRFDTSLEIE